MATLTVYPGVESDGARCSVLAQDLVTPIPDDGAVVEYNDYYAPLINSQRLLTDNPVEPLGPPISLVIAPVVITDSPSIGEVPIVTGPTTAAWGPAPGNGNPATNAPPSITTTNTLGSVSARFAREDHTHAFPDVTTAARGAMLAADKVLANDRWARVYSIHAGAQAGATPFNCNGVNQDWTALNTLLGTTIAGLAGARLLWSGLAPSLLTTHLTMAEKFEHDFQSGSGLSITNGVAEIVILGPVRASPRANIFAITPGGSAKVLLPGQRIHAEWFGSKADGGTTDGTAPIVSALGSLFDYPVGNPHFSGLYGGGGTLEFSDTRKEYGFVDPIELTSQSQAFTRKLLIQGPGKLRHTKDRVLISHATTPMIHLSANVSFGLINDFRLLNMTISGNGDQDYSQCFFMGGVKRAWLLFNRIENTAKEGFHFSGAPTSTDVKIIGNSAELNGKGDGTEVIAAYNPNVNQLVLALNTAYDVGMFVEQTGDDAIVLGNIFRKGLFRGVAVHSATHNSARCVLACNVIAHAPSGAFFADPSGTGAGNVHGNVIYDVAEGISLHAAGGHEHMATGNYLLGGKDNSQAYNLGRGAHVVQNEVISEVHGTTTGTIASAGTTTGTLTRGTTTGDTTEGSNVLVVASATGISTGFSVRIGGVTKRVSSISGVNLTMDSKYETKITASTVVWWSPLAVASATGIVVGGTINAVGMTGTKYVSAISGTNISFDDPPDAAVTGAAVRHSAPLVVPRETGMKRGVFCTIVGVSGTLQVLDDTWGVNVSLALDPPANAAVTGAAVTYFTSKWAYLYRIDFNDYHTIKHNAHLGIPWTTAVLRATGINFTFGPNTFNPRADSYPTGPDLPVIVIVDSTGGNLVLLRSDDLDLRQPWVYSGVERSYWTGTAWPTARPITVKVGDLLSYRAPASGGYMGEVITTAGTWGTLNSGATTATVTNSGHRQATLNSVADLYPGCKITIAGIAGLRTVATVDNGTKVITWPTSEATAGTTVAGAAVAFSAPVAKQRSLIT